MMLPKIFPLGWLNTNINWDCKASRWRSRDNGKWLIVFQKRQKRQKALLVGGPTRNYLTIKSSLTDESDTNLNIRWRKIAPHYRVSSRRAGVCKRRFRNSIPRGRRRLVSDYYTRKQRKHNYTVQYTMWPIYSSVFVCVVTNIVGQSHN